MALSTGKFVLGRVLSAVPTAVRPVFSLTGVTMPIVVTNLVLIEQVFSVPGVFTGMKRASLTPLASSPR